ncbi:hypothetical protein Clacol_009625 [Clathrus columnatus]|uniref:Major facilitator superfamily (MFS) profile domain-containing protein n=1 Tax=Clathrus columnatus TaxID=1419009 RepID=A0AAV5AQB2_9AGAM|nr:hypothetical protein Clacol_009625 [Clathrus columnatus]
MEEEKTPHADVVVFELPVITQETTDGDLTVVLQPTSDPADPLNWSCFWKRIILIQVVAMSMVAAFASSELGPGYGLVAKDFHIPINTATYHASALGTGSAIGTLLWTSVADAYGRRLVYLITGLAGFLAVIGESLASSFGVLLVCAAFKGLATAATSVLPPLSIADIFIRHERGARIGLWCFAVLKTNFRRDRGALGPVLGGIMMHAWGS